MKTIVFVLAAVTAAFVIGCQDNTGSNPVASQPTVMSSLYKSSVDAGTIRLDAVLRDPTQPLNEWIQVRGNVTYSVRDLGMLRETIVEVNGCVNADLRPLGMESPVWPAKCENCCNVKLGNQPSAPHDMTVPVTGRNLALHLRFHLTPETLQLEVMWLEPARPEPIPEGGTRRIKAF